MNTTQRFGARNRLRLFSCSFFLILMPQVAISSVSELSLLPRYCLKRSALSHLPDRHPAFSNLDTDLTPAVYQWLSQFKGQKLVAQDSLFPAVLQKEVIVYLLKDYLNLYLEGHETFSPYHSLEKLSDQQKAVKIYRQICHDVELKPVCREHRKELIAFFFEGLKISQLASGTYEPKNTEAYLKKVNQVLDGLREKYLNAKALMRDLLRSEMMQDGQMKKEIQGETQYNAQIQKILATPSLIEQANAYESAYLLAAQSFPGQILFSHLIRKRLESNYYNVNFTDLILSTEEISHEIEVQFKSIVLENPEVLRALEFRKKESTALVDQSLSRSSVSSLSGVSGVSEAKCDFIFHSWFQKGDLYPLQVSYENFEPMQVFSGGDVIVLEFLEKNQYQQAIWRLDEIGLTDLSNRLEAWVDESVLSEANAEKTKFLGGGFSTTKLVYFPRHCKGVYKPKPWDSASRHANHLQNIKDAIVSDYRKEIAAYRIDRLIHLNHVPLTKQVEFSDGIGSLQYFVNDTWSAHQMNEVNPKNPYPYGKWSKPVGRTILPSSIKFFDWLIDNNDRNIDNYLYLDNGRPILIDHGWTFIYPVFKTPSRNQMESMLPTRRIYESVLKLTQNPKILDQALGHLLSVTSLSLVKKKLLSFVQWIEDPVNHAFKEKILNSETIQAEFGELGSAADVH